MKAWLWTVGTPYVGQVFYLCTYADYSALIPAALMIGHHFAISALCKAPSASGVCSSRATTSGPICSIRARTPGSAKLSTIAALILPSTGGGVPLGAHTPVQTDVWNAGNPASSTVGMSGAAGIRVFEVTA